MIKNRKLFITVEIFLWSLIIAATVIAVMQNWALAEKIIQYIIYAVAAIGAYFYLLNRTLYRESEEKTKKLIQGQKELLNRQKTIDLIFNKSADGILILDEEKRIEEFSPGMERMTGYTKEEAIGREAQALLKFRTDDHGSLLPDLMFTMPEIKKGNPYIKNSLVSKDGKIVDVEASYTLIRGEKKGVHALAIIRDISYEKALTQRDKEFIAVTSHQLNTPLSIIRGYTSLLLSQKVGKLSTTQKQYLNEIHSACEKMVSLTGNLLSISRIEQEKIKLDIEDANVKDIIDKVAKNFADNEKIKQKIINLKIDPIDKNLMIPADQEKLCQALSNLFDNAIKYTKKGVVEISVDNKPDQVIIQIKDNGIGIAKENLDKIGERFYRSQNAINIDSKGTGLGVYITRAIVEKHRGMLNFESREGHGTTATVTLPKTN